MPPPHPPPIRACIFDMDGLLIDSEDLYTLVTNTILHRYNRPDLPWSIKAQMQGRPGPAAGNIFQDWAQLPIDRDELMRQVAELQRTEFPRCRALPGVEALLGRLGGCRVLRGPGADGAPQNVEGGTRGDGEGETMPMALALATSSHRANFEVKTGHLQALFDPFPPENRVLGDDVRIPVGRGKPAPDIYLLALKTVNDRLSREGVGRDGLVRPEECLVLEDSVPGVESGRRAGMVVWCPHPGLLNEYEGREEMVLAGLTGEHKESESKPAGDAGTNTEAQVVDGKPGTVGDGWAILLHSLENFPFKRFGIDA